MTFDNVDITDIDFCGGDLFVTMHNLNRKQDGKVIILNRYTTSKEMKVKYNVTGNVWYSYFTVCVMPRQLITVGVKCHGS